MTPTASELSEHRAAIIEHLEWRGRTLRIEFEADWAGNGDDNPETAIALLEVFVEAPIGAPIPVTTSGYRSHFLPPVIITRAGGAAAFVGAWLDEQARGRQWLRIDERWRQLDLFD